MPLIRISVSDRMSQERRKELPRAVYDAMRSTISIPEGDFFVVLSAHSKDELLFDRSFMGIERDDEFVLVQITFRRGRTVEAKQNLYREIARLFAERAALRPENVMIVVTENELADWSFGKGEAQYVLHPPAQAQPAGAV